MKKKEMGLSKTTCTFSNIELSEDFDISKDFELINTDSHFDSRYGKINYSKEDLEEMAENFNENILDKKIPVNIDHQRNDNGAEAWFVSGSMFVAKSKVGEGFSLFAKLEDFTPDMEKKLKEKRFRYPSLELASFKKFVGDKLTTFKNVVVGLAFTNFPVIKGLETMFSEKTIRHLTPNKMLKKILEQYSEKKFISLSEKDVLKNVIASYSDEEQAENKAEIDGINVKPEDDPAEEEKKAEEEEAKKAEETKKAELAEAKKKADKNLSEEQRKFSELEAEHKVLSEKFKEKELSETFDKDLALSESKKIGFNANSKDKVIEFLQTLSEDQVAEFSEIVKEIRVVDLSEYGNKKQTEKTDAEVDTKIREYAEKLEKDGMNKLEANQKAVEKFIPAESK